jgi:hypothetical protein
MFKFKPTDYYRTIANEIENHPDKSYKEIAAEFGISLTMVKLAAKAHRVRRYAPPKTPCPR